MIEEMLTVKEWTTNQVQSDSLGQINLSGILNKTQLMLKILVEGNEKGHTSQTDEVLTETGQIEEAN